MNSMHTHRWQELIKWVLIKKSRVIEYETKVMFKSYLWADTENANAKEINGQEWVAKKNIRLGVAYDLFNVMTLPNFGFCWE